MRILAQAELDNRIHSLPPAEWLVRVNDEYHKTGTYQTEDFIKFLGDPCGSVTIDPKRTTVEDVLDAANKIV